MSQRKSRLGVRKSIPSTGHLDADVNKFQRRRDVALRMVTGVKQVSSREVRVTFECDHSAVFSYADGSNLPAEDIKTWEDCPECAAQLVALCDQLLKVLPK